MDINGFIFSRTQPQKKIDIIKSLSCDELLAVKEATIKRMVKETGRKMGRTRDRELYISCERREGNAWNSTIESVDVVKNKIYINLYVQYSNTDSTLCEDYDEFFANGSYRGELHRTDRYGNPRTYYFIYSREAKATVVKAILLEYVFTKYAEKLKNQDYVENNKNDA